jgi:hypothetical protein
LRKVLGRLVPLGLKSTGRTISKNLIEETAMRSIKDNPKLGTVIIPKIGDTTWPGWSKLQYTVISNNGVKAVIHFVAKIEGNVIKAIDDFKFLP